MQCVHWVIRMDFSALLNCPSFNVKKGGEISWTKMYSNLLFTYEWMKHPLNSLTASSITPVLLWFPICLLIWILCSLNHVPINSVLKLCRILTAKGRHCSPGQTGKKYCPVCVLLVFMLIVLSLSHNSIMMSSIVRLFNSLLTRNIHRN